jgi:hypothetical protein
MMARRLAAYRAQFIGVVQEGRRRILANYLCSGTSWLEREGLRARYVQIFDGGECFFHAWYDPSDQSIHDISINGYA